MEVEGRGAEPGETHSFHRSWAPQRADGTQETRGCTHPFLRIPRFNLSQPGAACKPSTRCAAGPAPSLRRTERGEAARSRGWRPKTGGQRTLSVRSRGRTPGLRLEAHLSQAGTGSEGVQTCWWWACPQSAGKRSLRSTDRICGQWLENPVLFCRSRRGGPEVQLCWPRSGLLVQVGTATALSHMWDHMQMAVIGGASPTAPVQGPQSCCSPAEGPACGSLPGTGIQPRLLKDSSHPAVHQPATRLSGFGETDHTGPQKHVHKVKKPRIYSCCLQALPTGSGRIIRTSQQPGLQLGCVTTSGMLEYSSD